VTKYGVRMGSTRVRAKGSARRTSTSPTFVSLFSGCGGLDLGFLGAGYRCLLAIDNDAEALAVHSGNLASPVAQLDLVTQRPPDEVLRGVDAFVCGPPCQGFSTIGGRRPDDPRNSLLVDVAKLASIYMPKLVVIENVPGARSRLHDRYWLEAESLLRSAGFSTTTIALDVERLGLAQTRRRLVMLAWRTGFSGELALPSSAPKSIADVLTGVEQLDDHNPQYLAAGTRHHQISLAIGQGQKLCNVRSSNRCVRTWAIPEVFGSTSSEEREVLEAIVTLRRRNRARAWGDADPVSVRDVSRFRGRPEGRTIDRLVRRGFLRRIDKKIDIVHTFNGKYRRPHAGGPAPTVDSRFGDYHYVLHPTEHRGFTIREAARIQSFPDDYRFSGSLKSQLRMIGNAVPPAAALAVARLTRELI